MNKGIGNPWLQLGLRLVIGGIFTYAGALKLADPQAFADSIATFKLLPSGFINLAALLLPVLEILSGVALITGMYGRAAAFAVILMTAVFALAIAQALARGLPVDCGCFGSGEPSLLKTWLSLGRDILLLAGCLLIYSFHALKFPEASHAK